jgi:hypothetical protein
MAKVVIDVGRQEVVEFAIDKPACVKLHTSNKLKKI